MLRALSKATETACGLQRWGHTAAVLDGRKIASRWLSDLETTAADVTGRLGRPPGLGVVLVGNRPDSRIYVRRKKEAGTKIGIKVILHYLPESVSQAAVASAIHDISEDDSIDGILVQLPLPKHLNEEAIISAVDPRKDVDGFHPNHRQVLMEKKHPHFLPCTALGVMELIARSGINLQGKKAVVIGDSGVVGTPMAMLLQANGVAALTVCPRSLFPEAFAPTNNSSKCSQARADAGACLPALPKAEPHLRTKQASQNTQATQQYMLKQPHARHNEVASQQSQTTLDVSDLPKPLSAELRDLPSIARTADILVVAVGHAELVKGSWVKPGAIVIDVGINVVGSVDTGEYHVVGDVAYAEVAEVASAITPVPGGVGPMTIAAVLQNTIQAANLSCPAAQLLESQSSK